MYYTLKFFCKYMYMNQSAVDWIQVCISNKEN